MCIAASTSSASVRPTPSRSGARRPAPFSTPPTRTRSSSSAAPPRRSTWSRKAGARRLSKPATRSSSATSSTIRISCRGRCCASAWAPDCVVAPTAADGGFDLAAFEALLSGRTKMVAVTQVSNVTGAILPVERIAELAHAHGAKVLVDGCQAIPRMPVDVQALGCDFYVFSGHKAYGPSGIGVLWGRYDLLAADAAVADRRRHDHSGHVGEDRVPGAAAPLRGRHPGHLRRDGARPRARFHRRDRPRRHPGARAGADRLCDRPAVAHRRPAPAACRAAAAFGAVVQPRRGAPARRRHRAGPARGRGAGRAIIAPSR